MKVLFDLSVLGRAEGNPLGRTGIYRAVLNLARELQNSTEIDLTWSSIAAQSTPATRRAIAHESLRQSPLIAHGFTYDRLASFAQTVRRIDKLTSAKFPGLRFLTATLEHRIEAIESRATLPPRGTQIWHSTYLPLPLPRGDSRRDYVRFFTLYDLIPLKFPQYFAGLQTPIIGELVRSFQREDWIICISEATRNDLLNERPDLDPARVRVAYLAADQCFVEEPNQTHSPVDLSRWGIHRETPFILSVCTLEPRKNLSTVIQAFQKLALRHRDVRLLLVGGFGWGTEQIQQLLKEDRTGRITTTGYVADDDLATLYRASRAFVYMSHYEGFGLPVLEAMHCGTPVVCSNNSSLPEVVGNAAIQLDPLDTEGLEGALSDLLVNETLAERLRREGISRAKEFSWQRCAEANLAAYRSALGA